ncbi:MAG: glycosyltransferase family 2 protein [Bacteroidetes bacterium]|nr:glycosyltransferase family 2 protein [Bacteroidota bacterium]
MFVSGFTIIRNAVQGDYPVKEAVLSILPLVDEMIIAVGKSEDDTLGLIQSIDSPKIKIIETVWDDSLRKGGYVLAVETNKALEHVSPHAGWCFYIQADECVHEKDYPAIREAMSKYQNDKSVQGLVFEYLHFYGSYDYLADSRKWYRNEVRIIRNNPEIRSYMDAQGFRIDGKKLPAKKINARIYHYGWVKHPKEQMSKQIQARKLWHDDQFIAEKVATEAEFDYGKIDSIKRFEGTHPAIYHERIAKQNWTFDRDPSVKHLSFKNKVLMKIEKLIGLRIGEFRNYKLV